MQAMITVQREIFEEFIFVVNQLLSAKATKIGPLWNILLYSNCKRTIPHVLYWVGPGLTRQASLLSWRAPAPAILQTLPASLER